MGFSHGFAILALFRVCAGYAIVTAVSSNHFAPATWLLKSIREQEPTAPVIVYDLGLTMPQIQYMRGLDVEYRLFDYWRWPQHVLLAEETYAWKPIIIYEMLQKHGEVVWMDAGDKLHAPLQPLIR